LDIFALLDPLKWESVLKAHLEPKKAWFLLVNELHDLRDFIVKVKIIHQLNESKAIIELVLHTEKTHWMIIQVEFDLWEPTVHNLHKWEVEIQFTENLEHITIKLENICKRIEKIVLVGIFAL